METIKSVFEEITKDIVIDQKFVERIHKFERSFANRNEDHIAFFGGNLMGVHPMRFRSVDRESWFTDVLEIDDLVLEDSIRKLKSIDPSWHRANDVMNLSCAWTVYAILNSKHLSKVWKEQGAIDTFLILQYKYLGSLMSHWFPYPADQATMLAVYSELSRKYSLKVAGSWNVLLRTRTEELLSSRSVHHQAITTLTSDKSVIYMVNDIQGRLREIVKSMTAVFYDLKSRGIKIHTEKAVTLIDGSAVVKDKSKRYSTYIRYINEVISDKNSFIRAELIAVISDAMHTMPPKLLEDTLEWMSINHRSDKHEEVETLIKETLLHAFDLISNHKELVGKNTGLMPLLTKLRSLYMASRMSDAALLHNKQLAESIVLNSIKSKNSSVIASVRTSLQMYIVLRTMAMSFYQN